MSPSHAITTLDYARLAQLKANADYSPSRSTEEGYIRRRSHLLRIVKEHRHYEIVTSTAYHHLIATERDLLIANDRMEENGLYASLLGYLAWLKSLHTKRLQSRFFSAETPMEIEQIDHLDVKDTHCVVLVDAEDERRLNRYTIGMCGAYPWVNKESVHRNVMRQAGHDIHNKLVDHINNNRFDARKVNLRVCSHRQNAFNKHVENPLGYKGVSKIERANDRVVYRAQGYTDNRAWSIGYFDTLRDAALAWDIFARKHHGEYAKFNFPDATPEEIARVQELIDTPRTSSGYYGVSWHKDHQKWRGRINAYGAQYLVGYFDDEIEAARAVDKKRREVGGPKHRLNFPL